MTSGEWRVANPSSLIRHPSSVIPHLTPHLTPHPSIVNTQHPVVDISRLIHLESAKKSF
jgi:hypothetical protein